MATSEPISTPTGYWRLIPARHNGCCVYYHEGRNELAWEDPQDARLIELPAPVERQVRTDHGLPRTRDMRIWEITDALAQFRNDVQSIRCQVTALTTRMSHLEQTVNAHSAALAQQLGPEVD